MPPKASSAASKAKYSSPGKAFRGKGKKTSDTLPSAERVKRLYSSLVAQIDGGHWKGAEKTCDKILRIDPNDSDARQTKLFILLQREDYVKALELTDDASSTLSDSEAVSVQDKLFEKAYTLYRMKQESEAQRVLEQIKESARGVEEERGVLHLEAQLNYRQGNYQQAYDLYQQLFDTSDPSSEESHDVQNNLYASQTYLDFINSGYLQAIDVARTADSSTVNTLRDIENLPPPTIASTSAVTVSLSTAKGAPTGTVEEKKKVRMRRVPKGVVPGVTPPPDPERWIKKVTCFRYDGWPYNQSTDYPCSSSSEPTKYPTDIWKERR
ncbi:hypothetical protein GYMLUDRAFT_58254 [Collybiopsis luxurians FD-317 M1]|uniref:Signal recognition particle subunit SRP72 n=1 Tax=Collybiopsis luxurians FD-317 M1 TaxID=944289 RepID=A0A0D0C342_9AGAR|nr:hypothetical protein GYMLUDRAFT_58254 [Collybiopsis luxurians FD-317 M1]